MNATELKAFREMVAYSQEKMATTLGYSRRQYQFMEEGKNEIRDCVALACVAIALGILEYDGPTAEAHITRRRKDKGNGRLHSFHD